MRSPYAAPDTPIASAKRPRPNSSAVKLGISIATKNRVPNRPLPIFPSTPFEFASRYSIVHCSPPATFLTRLVRPSRLFPHHLFVSDYSKDEAEKENDGFASPGGKGRLGKSAPAPTYARGGSSSDGQYDETSEVSLKAGGVVGFIDGVGSVEVCRRAGEKGKEGVVH